MKVFHLQARSKIRFKVAAETRDEALRKGRAALHESADSEEGIPVDLSGGAFQGTVDSQSEPLQIDQTDELPEDLKPF